MPTFTSAYPNQTVQQLSATQTVEVGRLGRVVVLQDEDYTVDPRDDLVVLTATTSTGDWTVTFPSTLPRNHRVLLVMPAAPAGTDGYITDGLVAEATFDAAGQTASVVSLGGSSIVEGAAGGTTPSGDISAESLTATTGDVTVDAGNLVLTAGTIKGAGIPSYADNAAALAGGLVANDFYVNSTTNVLTRVVP